MKVLQVEFLPKHQFAAYKEEELAEEFIEILDAGFALQYGIAKSNEDGKIDWSDTFNFSEFIRKLPAAISGSEKVIDLFKNFTEKAKTSILDFVGEKFDLPDEEKEALIEETIKELLGDIVIANKWARYRKQAA